MADVNQVGQSALSKAPGPIRRLLSGINPQFSGYSGLSQGIGPQPAQGGPIAGVEPGSPNKILVTDPTRFNQSPRQTAVHEGVHVIQNNLSPAQQRAIPADTGNPLVALDPQYLASQRAAGKSILQLPKEQQSYLSQYYTAQQEAFEKGAITPQQMQQIEQTYGPWIQDFNKAQLSNIEPTDPSSSTLNTTPRAPMQPVSLQQDAVQFAPQQGPVTQSLLAGMNQPQQPAPQYVPPVVANTNKWAGIVQGALSGLGGGLKAGMQNVQDAGTAQGPHANGYAEGANASQQLQDAQKQQQDKATAQAQQDYENKMKSAQFSQEQQLNRARTMEANLHLLGLAKQMDDAPEEKKDAYYKEQDAHASDLGKQTGAALAEVPDLNGLTQWMQQNKKTTADIVATHHQDENGKDKIQIWQNPTHSVDAPTINRSLKAYGYPEVPAGTQMSYGDYHSLVGKAQGQHAEELVKTREQAQKDAAEMARTQVTQAGENSRAASKAGGAAFNEGLVDEIGTGKMAPERISYLATRNPGLLQAVGQKYPDFDSTKAASYIGTYKDFTSGKTSVALNAGGTGLKHLKELRDLNTDASHIPGTAAYNAYENKADTVASELARFYGTDTVPGIASIKKTLTATLPGQRDAAITTQAKSMGDKLDSFEQTWKNAAPSKSYQAAMPGIDDKAHEARASLDPDYKGTAQTFTVNGKSYNIPASMVSEFKKDHPDAR